MSDDRSTRPAPSVSEEARTRAAVEGLLEIAERGPYFTTDPGSIRREQLYER
jgi:hypothetical protein